jgi:hypothetical protein
MVFSIFNSMSGVYRIAFYRLYLKIPLSEVPVDFNVMGMSVFGTETTKTLMGDVEAGGSGRKHRLSLSRSASGHHETVVDEWIDEGGHIHHDEVKAPLLQHIAEDVVKLSERVGNLEKRVDNIDNLTSAPSATATDPAPAPALASNT